MVTAAEIRLRIQSRKFDVAGELGFEPRQTESESVVLPLHHSPKSLAESNNYRICLQRRRKEFFDPAEGEPFYSFSPGLGKRVARQPRAASSMRGSLALPDPVI